MEMMRISCAIFVVVASMSVALSTALEAPEAAPGPSSGSSTTIPVFGSLVGASLLSFCAFYLH
ncbi:hypothetical protein TanjilG_03331 [Lupinus angustifolius]|uniref:Arabinogalactan peptide 23-like n=1 Tax=Lupinus angustifolius TaxID=3871 RepID=A0A4P1RDU2_LUPAN|nr:hypothetical protein TanjilG_03331 [Lupinus angustifolius]